MSEQQRDPSKYINPPTRKPEELWAAYYWQCNVAAGFSNGPPELPLMDANDGKHPSELKRMKDVVSK